MKIPSLSRHFWFQAAFILFGAFIMTRLFVEIVEQVTFHWDDENAQADFVNKLKRNCENLQLDGDGAETGCYTYKKTGKIICAKVSAKHIAVMMGDTTYIVAESSRNIVLGSRTINTGEGDVEANILKLGAKLQELDSEEGVEKEKRGIRWLQALLDTIKSHTRWTSFFNGSIQFFIYFFSMIIIAFLIIDFQFLIKNRQQLENNAFLSSREESPCRREVEAQIYTIDEEISNAQYHPEIEPNILLNILKHSLETLLTFKSDVNNGELLSNIEAYGQGLQERVGSRFQIIRYFLNAIPSLGFIGTVWGISEALTVTSSLTGESLPYERMVANGALGQSLNFAFDTTLVGLVASIILSLLADWLENREISFVIDVRHKILNRFSYIQKII